MPRHYTIRVDTSINSVQHATRKVPIEAKEEIEKALQKIVNNGIITPVTEPTKWVSSLTYPRKSDGTICPCLDSHDLNKAIIHEHYKAPTLEEISNKLSGTTLFSKLDAKDGFWSIHLDTPYYIQHAQRMLLVPLHAIWTQDVPGCFPDAHGPDNQ